MSHDGLDLTAFLKEGSIVDLSWLDVDAEDYRKLDTLPKQNLEVQPDLAAAWSHEDKPSTNYLVPNTGDRPRTMGDLSEAHGMLRAKPEDILKTARLAMMQSSDPARVRDALVKRFDLDSLRAAKQVLAGVLAERGLLGKFYIDAADFPGCHNSPKQAVDFVRRFASDAKYLVAKPECNGCIHAQRKMNGTDNCAVFHKEIQLQVPYSDALATEVEQLQSAKGKVVEASAKPAKERIRLAMLADNFVAPGPSPMPKPKDNVARLLKPVVAAEEIAKPVDLGPGRAMARNAINKALLEGRLTLAEAQDGLKLAATSTDPSTIGWIGITATATQAPGQRVYSGTGETAPPTFVPQAEVEAGLIAASDLTKKRDQDMARLAAQRKAEPVVAFVRREMLKGRNAREVHEALKYAFSAEDVEATRPFWQPDLNEAGVYGFVYATQDSFNDCHEGADFLAKHNPGVKVMVAGAKCGGCIHNKIGRCLMYGKPLVASAEEAYTPELVARTVIEYKTAGTLRSGYEHGKTPKEQLQMLHTGARAEYRSDLKMPQVRQGTQTDTAHYMAPTTGHATGSNTKREIVRKASQYMNEGLYGRQLLQALKANFDPRDLAAAVPDLKPVIAEQGLQGVYFVDPTVYDDYGKGCHTAGRLHRSRLVGSVKVGSACGTCVHQRAAGFCSVINKPLVVEPPYVDKQAQQRAILASGDSTSVPFEKLVNNGMSMLAEYQMQNGGMEVDLNPTASAPEDIGIEFGSAGQGIKL